MNNLPISDGDGVIIAMTADLESPMYQHLLVWISTGVMCRSRYRIVTDSFGGRINPQTFEVYQTGNAILLVKDQPALTEFKEWWAKYSERYDGMEHENLLPVPRNNFISGFMVEHTKNVGSVFKTTQESYKDEWALIVANCPGKVYWTATHWIFADQNDAVFYRLKKETA